MQSSHWGMPVGSGGMMPPSTVGQTSPPSPAVWQASTVPELDPDVPPELDPELPELLLVLAPELPPLPLEDPPLLDDEPLDPPDDDDEGPASPPRPASAATGA